MRSRSELKLEAKQKLSGNILKLLGLLLIVGLITTIFQNIPGFFNIKTEETKIISFMDMELTQTTSTPFGIIWGIITNAFSFIINFGVVTYILKLIRGQEPDYDDIFAAFKSNILNIVIVSFLTSIFITLGTICLLIPAIIVSLGLSLCNYIMVDNPELKYMDVLKKSWSMMKGHKMNLFIFMLSFIGWFLLCILIVPIFYVVPYFIIAEAVYYEEIKRLN